MTASHTSVAIRILQPREWPQYRAVRLRALADAPDAFCSTLAGEQSRSDEDWAARLSAASASGQACPLIAELEGAVVGMVWAKVDAADPSIVEVLQMWVAPESRGHGVAASLLREAVRWAGARHACAVQLGVTGGGAAAARLYLREGFRAVGSPEPVSPGSPRLTQTMRLELGERAGRIR
jgi:GNAT superfamily N-acetyltransferase